MDSVDGEDCRSKKEPPGSAEEQPLYDSDESLLKKQYGPTGKQHVYESDESLLTEDHEPTDTHSLYDSDEPLLEEHQTRDMENVIVKNNEILDVEFKQQINLIESAETSKAHAKQEDDVTYQDEDHVVVSRFDKPVYTSNDIIEVIASESLENPAYTDSLLSTDSKTALLGTDYDGNLHCINFKDLKHTNESECDFDPDKEVLRDRSNTIGRLAESNAYIDSIGYTPDHAPLQRVKLIELSTAL
ncbi:hypothetical protein KUTeg_019915 [Tegillarca granosa]|uniref:Uncharacterized protein n=1 Tax=Tegillarca granosa TaxID=220873 RepID=A0ABQ9EDY4_TEGGR|nr:hypothetical protein KUTeg_019915 [Tegillarca granosa]